MTELTFTELDHVAGACSTDPTLTPEPLPLDPPIVTFWFDELLP